jgi:hypothetical protein
MTPHKDFGLDPGPLAPTPTLPPSPMLSETLQVCHPHAAGIDIGEAEHWVAVPPGCDPQPVRRFGTFTADLDALADWLLECGVTTVAMESTGVYWIPLFELLEARGVQVLLIDPRQAKRVPGRPKSDRLDCKWLQRLHSYGLLAGAFRPANQVCVLRGYLRHRQMLLTYAAHHIQHMHKALEQMNLKLTQVVSEITGVTGMAILKAILAGERDPSALQSCATRTATTPRTTSPRRCRAPGAPNTCLPYAKRSSCMPSITSRSPNAISRSKPIWKPFTIKVRASPYLQSPTATRKPTNPGSMPARHSIAWPAST